MSHATNEEETRTPDHGPAGRGADYDDDHENEKATSGSRRARRRGRPYDAQPDPTPGHVRSAAGSDAAVKRWASALEETAYGAAVVDERAQAEVDRLAPDER